MKLRIKMVICGNLVTSWPRLISKLLTYIYSMGKARFITILNVKTLGHLTKPVSFPINERLDLGTLFKITFSLKVHCETLDPLQ